MPDQRHEEFVGLLTASHDKLLGYLLSLLGRWHDAQDVLQRASVLIWQDHAWGGPVVTALVGTPSSDIENGRFKMDTPDAQFYDLEADRKQTTNLYSRFPEVVAEMKATLESYRPITPPVPKKRAKNKNP